MCAIGMCANVESFSEKSTHTDRYLHAKSHHHSAQNNQLSTHLYIELSSSLTKNIYRIQPSETSLTKRHDKKDINKVISKHKATK